MLTRESLFFLVACLRDVPKLSVVEPSHGSCSGGDGSIDQNPSCNIMFSKCPVVLCFELVLVVSFEVFLGAFFTSLVSLFSHVFKPNGNVCVCSGSSSGLGFAWLQDWGSLTSSVFEERVRAFVAGGAFFVEGLRNEQAALSSC